MLNFPDKKYQIIYADPPFSYHIERDKATNLDGTKRKLLMGSTKRHYETMTLEEICNLPVQQIADKNCYLFLWASSPTLKEALEVMERWGFTYKVIAFVWSKTNREMGLGHYTRTNHEFVLLGTKGSLERKSNKVKQWLKAPTTIHSKKPNEIRERIIQLYGDLQRIELFSRTKIHGWDVIGNDEKLQNQPLEAFSHQLINKELLID
jgi:N6-adenosine-specific RNA methylase IME4